MKSIFTIVALNWLFISCLFAQTKDTYEGQVVNVTDANNLKQGLWVYYYDTLHTMVSCKGNFVNDKREGVWTTFYRSGTVKSTITYANNKEAGYVRFYYEDGKISEEGTWINNHWVGEYRYYYSSGQLAYEWNHDESGRRSGHQQYFYENGKLRISGNWVAGKEDGTISEYYDSGKLRSESQWKNGFTHGVMKEYYADGSIMAERIFNNGVYDAVASSVYREQRNKPQKNEDAIVVPAAVDVDTTNYIVDTQIDSPELFTGTGFHRFYNSSNQIDREGNFVNGNMINGKKYYYNASGKLIRIAIYENGRIVNTIDKE